jgi:hypothetical protein
MKSAEISPSSFFGMNKEATQERTPIYIRITVCGQGKEWSTGIKIDPFLRIKKVGRLKGRSPAIPFTDLCSDIQSISLCSGMVFE